MAVTRKRIPGLNPRWAFVQFSCSPWSRHRLLTCPGYTLPPAKSQLGHSPAPWAPEKDEAGLENGWICSNHRSNSLNGQAMTGLSDTFSTLLEVIFTQNGLFNLGPLLVKKYFFLLYWHVNANKSSAERSYTPVPLNPVHTADSLIHYLSKTSKTNWIFMSLHLKIPNYCGLEFNAMLPPSFNKSVSLVRYGNNTPRFLFSLLILCWKAVKLVNPNEIKKSFCRLQIWIYWSKT